MRLFDLLNESIDLKELKYIVERDFGYDGKLVIKANGTVSVLLSKTGTGRLRLATHYPDGLPIKFNSVVGNVGFDRGSLPDLEGSPKVVKGYFDCSHNNLSNLVGGPEEVRDTYSCYSNPLESLEGLPLICNGSIILTYDENLPLLRLLFVKGLQDIELYHGRDVGTQIENILRDHLGQGRKGAIAAAAKLSQIGCKGNARL